MAHPRFFKQFIKFGIVGTIGMVIDFGVLILLKELFLFPLLIANAFSFSAAVMNNYTLNTYWTFADQEREHRRQLIQFAVVSVIGLTLSTILLFAFHDIAGGVLFATIPDWWYIIAKALAILIVMFWNFLANRFWTFKR